MKREGDEMPTAAEAVFDTSPAVAGAVSPPLLAVKPGRVAAARIAVRAGRRCARARALPAPPPWRRAARGLPGSEPSAAPALQPIPAPRHRRMHRPPGSGWLVHARP